jgi:hypothetical protein
MLRSGVCKVLLVALVVGVLLVLQLLLHCWRLGIGVLVVGGLIIKLTSPTLKVCVFSEGFRYRKIEDAYFTFQFLNNYRLKPHIL